MFRLLDLVSWVEDSFGPLRNMHPTAESIKLDFASKKGHEKCVSTSPLLFRDEELKLLGHDVFFRDDYDLSVFVSDYGSTSPQILKEYFVRFGKIIDIRKYDNCMVVKFSTEEERDSVLDVKKIYQITNKERVSIITWR